MPPAAKPGWSVIPSQAESILKLALLGREACDGLESPGVELQLE